MPDILIPILAVIAVVVIGFVFKKMTAGSPSRRPVLKQPEKKDQSFVSNTKEPGRPVGKPLPEHAKGKAKGKAKQAAGEIATKNQKDEAHAKAPGQQKKDEKAKKPKPPKGGPKDFDPNGPQK